MHWWAHESGYTDRGSREGAKGGERIIARRK